MRPSPNPYLIRLTPDMAPERWRSRQAERLFRAAIEGDTHAHAVSGNILVATPPASAEMSPHGTDPEVAARRARIEIDRLRAQADHLEGVLDVYGGEAFIEQMRPVARGSRPITDAESVLLAATERATHVRVNGTLFERDNSGSLVEATERRPQ